MVRGVPAGWGVCFCTVSLGSPTIALSYWNNLIAVGSKHGDIIILDAITGSQTAVLLGHTDEVRSVAFSSDGKLLVSGSDDMTVKLWDVQTGGVIKTFSGHTDWVRSVSISVDCTIIASGSLDKTIHLWNIQTGECYCVIEQQDTVYLVIFSPRDPQYLLSESNNQVRQWDINGHQVGPTSNGYYAAFSLDSTQFALYYKGTVTVQNSSSGETVAEFHQDSSSYYRCCFSPNGRFIAASAGRTACVWGIARSEPHLIETFIGHTNHISFLTFSSPSSLISLSDDQSVKFWRIGVALTDPVEIGPESTSLTSAQIQSITLQARDGIIITSDSDGLVKTWDISTGLCKASFQNPAKDLENWDVQLSNGRLILAWYAYWEINIWDVEKEEITTTVNRLDDLEDLKISWDGSRVFSLDANSIQVHSVQTGEIMGEVGIERIPEIGSLIIDGSKVWACYPNLGARGWDFESLGSSPVALSPDGPHSNSPVQWDAGLSGLKENATGKVVFQLPKRYGKIDKVQWDGQYLVACYEPTKFLILDFSHVLF